MSIEFAFESLKIIFLLICTIPYAPDEMVTIANYTEQCYQSITLKPLEKAYLYMGTDFSEIYGEYAKNMGNM